MTQQEYENKIKELEANLEQWKTFENKFKEIEAELEQLKVAKIEAEQPKRWKPKYDEEYWGVDYNGLIFKNSCGNDSVDNWCYLTGNCFKTKEEAEEYKKQIEYTARYKNYIEEHSEPIDWDNEEQKKCFAYFGSGVKGLAVDHTWVNAFQGTIYASSEKIIWDAIKEIGEDNFKKYVLGVK